MINNPWLDFHQSLCGNQGIHYCKLYIGFRSSRTMLNTTKARKPTISEQIHGVLFPLDPIHVSQVQAGRCKVRIAKHAGHLGFTSERFHKLELDIILLPRKRVLH